MPGDQEPPRVKEEPPEPIAAVVEEEPAMVGKTAAAKKAEQKICHLCGATFPTYHMLLSHGSVHTGEPPYGCGCCRKRLWTKDELLKHVQAVHIRGVYKRKSKRFACKHCPARFSKMTRLMKHVAKRHRRSHKQFNCKFCHKAFRTQSQLLVHVVSHMSLATLKYWPKAYTSILKPLEQKRPSHQEAFEDSVLVANEMRDSYSYTPVKPHQPVLKTGRFACKLCVDQFFASKSDMRKHHATHINTSCLEIPSDVPKVEDQPKKSYPCPHCPTSYESRSGLRVHLGTHPKKLNSSK